MDEFNSAVQEVQKYNPDNTTKLKLYALYKQVNFGDCNTPHPGWFAQLAEKYKWEKWQSIKGKSKDDAMKEYVEIVKSLRK